MEHEFFNCLQYWEKLLLRFLDEHIPEGLVSLLIDEHHALGHKFFENIAANAYGPTVTPSIGQAVAGINQIYDTAEVLTVSMPVSMNDILNLGLLAFTAGNSAGMVAPGRGMEVFKEKIEQDKPLVKKAGRFCGKYKRQDDLAKVLHEIIRPHVNMTGKRPPWGMVRKALERLAVAGHPIIQEVDGEAERVLWYRATGTVRGDAETSFRRVNNRVSDIAKKIIEHQK